MEKLNISPLHPLFMLLLFLCSPSVWAVDPTRHISQYAHTAWRVQDGFFRGAPNVITQTADGYLWIGTQSELARFDGVRFVPWVPPTGKRLSNGIFSLLPGSDGSLWIGTGSNLAHLKNGDLINYLDRLGDINSILEDRDGTIWIARSHVADTAGPLCEVTGTKLRCYGKADGIKPPYAESLAKDSEGNLWIGSSTVLIRWKSGSSSTYTPSGLKTAEGLRGIAALAVARSGSLWVGMIRSGQGLGLQQLVRDVWKPFIAPGLDGSMLQVSALLLDRENALWIGTTNQGIYRIHDARIDRFFGADGLSSDSVSSFYEDREGNLWVATSGGIDCFRDTRIISFSTREGLSANLVDSVLASQDGTIWMGNSGALDSLREQSISSVREGKGLSGHRVTSLLEDHAGRLWVGADNRLSVYEEHKFRTISRRDGTPIGVVIAMTEDRDHDIWAEAIGDPARLIRVKDLIVREELPAPKMPAARSLAADPQSGIWLGLINGDLARYRLGQLEIFPVKHGQNPGTGIRQLSVASDGSVLGATPEGLIGWRDGRLHTLNVKNGLPCDILYGLISDIQGNLWLYAECGLVRIANTELQKWWGHGDTVVQIKVFDVFDGARPGAPPFQPRSSRSPDGRLWFANENVVQVIDPAHLAVNAAPPPVHVEEVVADRKNYPPQQGLGIPPLTRDLEIDYTALSLAVPQKVRFRYKLEGRDGEWQDAGTRRQAFYTDLRPAHYRFRVIACNSDGVWNQEGETLNFSILPAWYQENWFRFLCVCAGFFVAWSFYRLRVRQVARVLRIRFDERLAERTRMARDLHDTFLQTIQGSKLVADNALDPDADPTGIRGAMEQLSAWLGRATQESRAALNSLRSSTEQRNDLADALQNAMEECRLHNPIKATFSVVGNTEEMHPIVRDEIYRIAYEAIHNAYTHSKGTRLEVGLSYSQDLTVRVKDNGVGIDPAVVEKGKQGHFGLQGMRERAARIGSKFTVVSSPSSGTEITVVVPGRIVFRKASKGPIERIKNILRRSAPASNLN